MDLKNIEDYEEVRALISELLGDIKEAKKRLN